MSKNIQEIPFTEIQERVASLGSVAENTKEKMRGIIQDVYLREVTNKHDWNFLIAESSIVTIQEYKTGTISATTGSQTVTFSSDAVLTAAMTGRKIKIYGNEVVYDFTFSNTTGGTVTPSFEGPSNVTNGSYSIFQPHYALSSDFDRFPKDGGIYKWEGGNKKILSEEAFQENAENYTSSPSIPEKVKLVHLDTAGNQLLEFRPPPKDARVYGNSYIRKVRPLIDTTAGTVTISANGTSVTGHSTKFTEATTGDYIRINAFGIGQDSTWYRVISVVNDTTMTIQAFANSAITSSNYAVSRIPEMPAKLHMTLIYGPLRTLSVGNNEESAVYYNMKMAETVSDGKRLYVTRVYSQDVGGIHEDYHYRR